MCERGDDAAATEEAMATEGAVETREVPADGVDSAERAEDDEGRGNGTETSEGAGATDPERRASTAVTAVRKITAWIGKDDAGAKGRQRAAVAAGGRGLGERRVHLWERFQQGGGTQRSGMRWVERMPMKLGAAAAMRISPKGSRGSRAS